MITQDNRMLNVTWYVVWCLTNWQWTSHTRYIKGNYHLYQNPASTDNWTATLNKNRNFPVISKFRVDWWLNSHQKYKRQFPFIFKFRVGWLFYLSTLQKRVLTVSNRFPQFDNMECDGTKNGWKHSWKERDPNKLGTRNSLSKAFLQFAKHILGNSHVSFSNMHNNLNSSLFHTKHSTKWLY